MTDNVIDATDRFAEGSARPKTTVLDLLRRTRRVALPDRPVMALRLGIIATKLDPDRPRRAAKAWFEQAWQGDRWAKRKRFVLLPGDTAPDPEDDGAYVATGSDWAALIERAAFAQHPGSSPVSTSDRNRAIRDILRGTTFVPAIAQFRSMVTMRQR